MQYWVFTIGHRDDPPPRDWLAAWPHHVTEMWFPRTKRPVAIKPGDKAVIYGSQGRGFIAAVEVVSNEPERNDHNPGRAQYPWKLRHRLLASKPADGNVASPQDAGIHAPRVVRGPHTKISQDEYDRAVAALLEAAAESAAS